MPAWTEISDLAVLESKIRQRAAAKAFSSYIVNSSANKLSLFLSGGSEEIACYSIQFTTIIITSPGL